MFRAWREKLGALLMLTLLFSSFGFVSAAVAPPNIVTYQGRVLNANGVPVADATLSMKFALYSALTGGTCLWSNDSADCYTDTPASIVARTVTLTSGLFTENIGDTSDSYAAIADTVFGDNATVYLEVIIAGETLTPRRRFTAAPYALNSQRLDGIDSTGFLASTGDTGTGDYDLTGAELVGASPIVFEGGSNDGVTSTFAFTDPTVNRTITFQNASGTVAYSADIISAAHWETGANGTVEDDAAVIIGTNAAFTYGSGGVGDLKIIDELEVMGDGFIDNDLVIGASTSSTETLAHSSFTLGGDDLFVAGTIGVEGAVYSDSGFVTGTTTTFGSASITETGTSFTMDVGNTGSFIFRDGSNTLFTIADAGTTGNATLTGDLTISGDDLTMGTNTSGYMLVADGTNFNPVSLSGDISIDGTGATSIGADIIDFTEMSDSLSLDASTSIAMDGSEILTFTNGSTGDIVFNLSSTGDFVIQDAGVPEITFTDGGKLQIEAASEGIAMLNASSNVFAILEGSALAFQDLSSNIILSLQDISTALDHTIYIDSDTALAFDSNADSDADITTVGNEALYITAEGTGDVTIGLDADTALSVSTTAAPAEDMVVISNASKATTTADVNALSIIFEATNTNSSAINIDSTFTGGAADGLEYSAIVIQDMAPTNSAGADTVIGLDIRDITDPGSSITSYGMRLGSGYEAQILLNDTTSIIDVAEGGTITFRDGTNTLAQIVDTGTSGRFIIKEVKSTTNTVLAILGGDSTSTDAGENVTITGGTNDVSTASGGNGGQVLLTGGAATGNGASPRNGGDVVITSGASAVSTGDAGDVSISGGNSTSGTQGDVIITSGGSPSSVVTNGGDIGFSAKDDFMISADDDVTFSVTSASSVVNLFDNAVSKTIDIGGVDADSADTINIGTNNTSADAITIGSTHATSTLELNGGNFWSITDAGIATFDIANTGSFSNALCWDASGISAIEDCTSGPTADYAEMYPMASGIGYGDIVVLGSREVVTTEGDTITELVKSSNTYQGPVVGIVSNNYGDFTSAGYNINAVDNPWPVALVGRVPVKVTSEGGSVSVGDYLTTSSTSGKAMRATKVGRVIGMALEEWDGVSDTVMVQVNNSWSMGDVIGTDGTSTLVTDNVIISGSGTATATTVSFDSYGLELRGSAWNGSEASAVEMMLQNTVDTENSYRLSIRNTNESEVAYITNEGTMKVAGDMIVGGNIYPSDRGTAQTDKYIYYDGSAGAGGDFMRTNAKGWSTGSYDFAEMFPSKQSLTAGDIVVFAGSGETIQRATGAKGEQLAGIVSTRPGFLAGENLKGAYPIALAGRVPTKVSAENGVIAVGDPLAPSSVSGVAMKATEAGQIAGYALEAYSSTDSDNLILAYVNVGYWSGLPTETVPIVQNTASAMQVSGTNNFASLNMSGNIYMATNQILSIGRLEGISSLWSIESDGTIKTESVLKTVIDSYQGKKVETVAVTSPEVTITLTGTSTLVNGTAEVRFESVAPEYNDVISADAPIRVIVTPNGPVSLYVSERDQNHFVVQRFAGSSDVEFDWMVTAYRKGYEPSEEDVAEDEPVEEEFEVVEEILIDEIIDEVLVEEEVEEEIIEETVIEEVVVEEEEDIADEVIVEEEVLVVEEEPAAPASPEETLIDSKTQSDDGEPAEEPLTS